MRKKEYLLPSVQLKHLMTTDILTNSSTGLDYRGDQPATTDMDWTLF